MLPQERLHSLQRKRSVIAHQIEEEEKSPSMDPTLLRHLKKQKLELRDIIAGIKNDGHQEHTSH